MLKCIAEINLSRARSLLTPAFGSIRRYAGALALSGISQVVSSLTNFGIMLYLVRILEKGDFGCYSFGISAYLVIAAVLAAMFAVQYVVNNPDQAKNEQRPYAMHHVAAVALTATVVVLLAAVQKVLLSVTPGVAHPVLGLTLPVALATLGFSTRDMAVRIAFVERREWLVLGSVMTVAVTAAIAFLVAAALSYKLSATTALCIVAMSQMAGAAFMLAKLRLPWRQLTLTGLRHAFVESWHGGRWHATTSIVYSVRTQAHNFVILPILGLATLAEVNAARTLLAPAVMVAPPLYQVVMPHLAKIRKRNAALMQCTVWLTIGSLVGFALIYSATLMLALDIMLPLVLGPSYTGLEPVVMAWSAVTVCMAARNGLTMGLETRKNFRDLTAANTVAALIGVIAAVGLAVMFGGAGAVWALALAELALCLLLYQTLARANAKERIDGLVKIELLCTASTRGSATTRLTLQDVAPTSPNRSE